jgi:type IV pilus assembly protein PilV
MPVMLMITELNPRIPTRPGAPSLSRGVGMIEILIALFVVAIGMLGIAGLQFMSKRSNFEAVQRTAASMLAQDIIERMRANYSALSIYSADLENGPVMVGGETFSNEPAPVCTEADPCNDPADIARHDLWEWERAIDGVTEQEGGEDTGGLTLPTACIYSTVPGASADRSGNYIVAIAWRGPTEMANPVNPVSGLTPDPYTCGEGLGLYDGEGTDTHRRILFIETYINAKSD